MARVTVEDCILKIPNRFDLVMLAAQRSRDISSGAPLTVEKDNDKSPVIALREIAEETVPLDELGESLIRGMQKHIESDEPDEDLPEFDVPTIPGIEMGPPDSDKGAGGVGLVPSVDATLESGLTVEETPGDEPMAEPAEEETPGDEPTAEPDETDAPEADNERP